MKALVFAAGIGSRLRPFTDRHPKALAEVGGVPMLQRTIEKLRDAGADRIVVNVHHFACQIKEFLDTNSNFGTDIAVSDESECLLDTGGGLLNAEKMLCARPGEPIILHNADILTDVSLTDMMRRFADVGVDAMLLVGERPSSRQLYFSHDGALRGWCDHTTEECRPQGFSPAEPNIVPRSFNGVHIVGNNIFRELHSYARQHGKVFSITPFYIDAIGKLTIHAYEPPQPLLWHDIGTPEKLAIAEAALKKRQTH